MHDEYVKPHISVIILPIAMLLLLLLLVLLLLTPSLLLPPFNKLLDPSVSLVGPEKQLAFRVLPSDDPKLVRVRKHFKVVLFSAKVVV